MKKNIGTNLALYPTPLVVVGTMVDGKPNYTLVGHLGIIGQDRIKIIFSNIYYSNHVFIVPYLLKQQQNH